MDIGITIIFFYIYYSNSPQAKSNWSLLGKIKTIWQLKVINEEKGSLKNRGPVKMGVWIYGSELALLFKDQ